jgi:hypothetical protein
MNPSQMKTFKVRRPSSTIYGRVECLNTGTGFRLMGRKGGLETLKLAASLLVTDRWQIAGNSFFFSFLEGLKALEPWMEGKMVGPAAWRLIYSGEGRKAGEKSAHLENYCLPKPGSPSFNSLLEQGGPSSLSRPD